MKEASEYLEARHHSIECFNNKDKINASELDKITDFAGKNSDIGHDEIRELTKIILKIDPTIVDESLQAKFNMIMNKVRAQYT